MSSLSFGKVKIVARRERPTLSARKIVSLLTHTISYTVTDSMLPLVKVKENIVRHSPAPPDDADPTAQTTAETAAYTPHCDEVKMMKDARISTEVRTEPTFQLASRALEVRSWVGAPVAVYIASGYETALAYENAVSSMVFGMRIFSALPG
ncbi:hypothetical protein EXIGLDRAFT_773481 [Exidia glandulosa HHB12029]|uniref:Uncharacterized protein n=1 Tax=Exidia glandulosa HHB12029 TaxID=1314781 RepID=A0A165ET62_EXIGL|nr:hypothetical protein EXIGLDRAFT_773481 [Exidia glandulosa HHB12029]